MNKFSASLHQLAPQWPFQPIVKSFPGGTIWMAYSGNSIDRDLAKDLARKCFTVLREERPSQLIEYLGLDFGVAVSVAEDRRILLGRGPLGRAALFFHPSRDGIRLSSSPWDAQNPGLINPDHLSDFLANNLLPAPIDCNHTLLSAAAGWMRVPRGTILTVDSFGEILGRQNFNLPALPALEDCKISDLEARLRAAVDEHLTNIVGSDPVTCEVSGGIDSGIIAARARKLFGDQLLAGVSLVSPYFELRREIEFIDAIASFSGVPIRKIDPSYSLPFTALDQVPFHDEPNLTAIPWRLLWESLEASRQCRAHVHLHGIGGDQIFLDPPQSFTTLNAPRRSFSFLTWQARQKVFAAVSSVRNHYFGRNLPSYFDRGLMIYDGWTDRTLAPKIGIRYEPGLVSWKILRLAEALRRRKAYSEELHKPVPRVVFAEDLPENVRTRRGKVGFDGVYQRGLRQNLEAMLEMVEQANPHLENQGVRTAVVIRNLRQIAQKGWDSLGTPLIALLAWLAWRNCLIRAGVLSLNDTR